MTHRPHGDTEAPARGFDAVLERSWDAIVERRKSLVVGAAVLLGLGVIAAAVTELRARGESQARVALAQIEADFVTAMGGQVQDALVAEPANPEQAKAAREEAVERLDRFIDIHARSSAAPVASIRAAELEMDLGRYEQADVRLAELLERLSEGDPRRGIALRLRGYGLDEQGKPEQAAQAYEAAGSLEAYPPRALAWLAAGHVYARLDRPGDAVRAYNSALAIEPDLKSDTRLQRQISALDLVARARSGQQ